MLRSKNLLSIENKFRVKYITVHLASSFSKIINLRNFRAELSNSEYL